MLNAGDFVLIQFGHNDGGPLNDASRARGTIKGVGEQSEEIDNLLTKEREVVHSYGWYLRKFVADARAKAQRRSSARLCHGKPWRDGRIARNTRDYAGWAQEVATAAAVPLLDLNELIAQRYESLGHEKVNALFADEHTHTSAAGAELNADVVVAALQTLPTNPLKAFLRAVPDRRAVPAR